jgi:hypothetical protein|tara:strand:+ start:4158 stop:4439 length:282 start_codon:yes stop_codon:yes gene_type:complete
MSDTSKSYKDSVCALVDFVREHPSSGASDYMRRVLCSLAFSTPVSINLAGMAASLDEKNMALVLTAIQTRAFQEWPSDYISDEELRVWDKEAA